MRFRAVLKEAVEKIRDKPTDDSPVYTFLKAQAAEPRKGHGSRRRSQRGRRHLWAAGAGSETLVC